MSGSDRKPASSPPESPSGKALKEVGGFELINKIGQGAMGAVFKARQKSLDREVALKILPPSIAKDKSFTKRFVREARASAKLTHPNIVSGIDVGQDGPTELWYFAMEYIDGPSVRQFMTDHGKIEEDKALKIARDIARALECAHENKMVHRDVKPDNILLTSEGTAKLADLGLVRQTIESDGSLTQSGKALGTPHYMAPEQIRGETNNLDTRTDLYALGASLFHMVTGQVPFPGETSAVIMARHLSDPPPLANRINPNVSQGCSRLIQRLMQKDRNDRCQDPAEVIEQIDRMLKLSPAARGLATGARAPLRPKSTTGPRAAVRSTSGPRAPIRGATTSAREIVQGRSDSIRKTTSRNPMALVVGIAGGVAVVVIVGLIMASARGPSGTTPQKRTTRESGTKTPEKPKLTSAPAKGTLTKEQLAKRWAAAQNYAEANPEDYPKIRHRYQTVLAEASGSPLATEIQGALRRVQKAWDAATEKTWADIEAQIAEASNAGDYDTALASLSQPLPKAHAARLKEKVAERRQTLQAEANGKIDLALQQAGAASMEAKPADGLKALESIAHIKYAAAAPKIQQMKERLERELGSAAELAGRRAVLEQQKKLDGFLERFDIALLEGDDVPTAKNVAGEAARGEWPEGLKPTVDAMGVLLKAYGDLKAKRTDMLGALKGQKVSLGEGEGVIEKIEGDTLHVTISLQGGRVTATKRVALSDLPATERARLLPPLKFHSDEARVASALGNLQKGREDFPAATTALEQASTFPLTPHYLDLVRRRQLGAAERLAEQAWKPLAEAGLAPLTKTTAEKLYERVLAFQEKHGASEFVKEHAAELNALRARVAAIAKPNCLVNGDFEGGDTKGWTLLAFKGVDEPVVEVTAEAAHGGGKGVCFKTSGRLQQTVSLEPGQAYHFSCWVRNAGSYIRVGMVGGQRNRTVRTGTKRDFAQWTQISFTFTATQAEHVFEVVAYHNKKREGYQACFDDIRVMRGTGATGVAVATARTKAPADAIRFQGSAYKVFEKRMSWEEARDFCDEQGGWLVCVESRGESEFITNRLLKERMWLGGRLTENGWEWVNGAPFERVVKIEETKSRGEDYLSIQEDEGWRDTPRSRLPFICEWDAPAVGPGATATGIKTPTPPTVAPAEPIEVAPVEPGKAGPVATGKVVQATAQFLSENTDLRGNWKGTYGSEGYAMCGSTTKLPPYAKLTISGKLFRYEKEQARGDTRGLTIPEGDSRVAAANYVERKRAPLVIGLSLTDGRPHPVTFYLVDYKRAHGRCKLEIVDPKTGQVLASHPARYGGGIYLTFNISGTVEVRLGPDKKGESSRREPQPYFHISGVFFK